MLRIATTVAAVAICSSASNADVITLNPMQDNTLFEHPTGALSNGAGDSMFSGRNGQGLLRRGLLAFDIAGSLPAGAQIQSVELTLHVVQGQGGLREVGLHSVMQAWGEGASSSGGGNGAPAQPGDATWLHTFSDTELWNTPGGDFESMASQTQLVDSTGDYTWDSSAALVSDVQAWLDNPLSNHGWAIIGDEGGANNTAKRFSSRESSNAPLLEVTYVIPAPSAMLLLLGVGVRRRRR